MKHLLQVTRTPALALGVLLAFPLLAADDDAGKLGSPPDPSAGLIALDAANGDVVSSGPFAKVTKNLDQVGTGIRAVNRATTDVWAHDGYAYTGTFNNPCGGDPEAGVWIWDVHNTNNPSFVGIIPSPAGSRSNDVRVASMNSGDILVHSNESCGGGRGGFEIYNVDDPANPVLQASVQIDELNPISNALFGGLTDVGVHNLWLFTQGSNDYVAAVSEGAFDNFRIYDITTPSAPTLVSGWGAEEIFDPGVGDETVDVGRVLDAALDLLSGFGASQNKFLHDATITADGTRAYLANWDAGLVLLDISDPTSPSLVSVAIDPVNGSRDGEVNSHSVWPSEDGRIVVEGEEDFSARESAIVPTNLTLQNLNTIAGVAVSTSAGDTFEEPANQTSNAGTVTATSVAVTAGPLAGETFTAVEFTGNNVPLDGGSVSGNLVWVGRACNGDPLVNPLGSGDIAVVRRGACFFSDKAANVAAAGASAMVLANNQLGTPWGGLRVWDYSDPANPVLASTFNTVCSADPVDPSCDPAGTYSSHNVIVETTGNKNPIETARYTAPGENFWGIYKEPNSPWIFGSDRNNGLVIFKEKGAGSAKKN
jgi:hypothetical protein